MNRQGAVYYGIIEHIMISYTIIYYTVTSHYTKTIKHHEYAIAQYSMT